MLQGGKERGRGIINQWDVKGLNSYVTATAGELERVGNGANGFHN